MPTPGLRPQALDPRPSTRCLGTLQAAGTPRSSRTGKLADRQHETQQAACKHMLQRLQPCVVEAATICSRGCNGMWLQPDAIGQPNASLATLGPGLELGLSLG